MATFSSKHATVLCCLLLLCCYCDGLSPPYDLHWSIDGAYVHITWKHSHSDEPLNGYYVSVQQEGNHAHEQTGPDFVHLDKNVRSTNIQGLIPDSVYLLKVVAYSGDIHRSSKPVKVKTKDLELLAARNLTISSISTTGALFQWEHDAKHTVHDIQFKLACRGARQYTDDNNKLIEEADDFEHSVYASSQGKESYYANTLQSNTKYSCHISTVAETVEGPPTNDVSFMTSFGAPTPPGKPKVLVHHNSSFTVLFYHSNERFGPISHYKVFAVPMKKETDLPINSRFVPLISPSMLLKHAVSPQVLTHESSPTPFLVGTYQFRKLPKSIAFNGNEMRLSFKPKTHYSFITAVFTKAESKESEGLHSFSAPADPPVFISADLQEDWIQQHQPVAKHFTIIVTCTLVSVTLLFVAGFLSAFASNYYKGKKRDAYFFTVADNDSSEEELYSKPKTSSFRPTSGGNKKEVMPLLGPSPPPSPTPKTPSPTLKAPRDDLSESQTYCNPVFEEVRTQEPFSDHNRSQLASQNPKYPSNSPAKISIGSIHDSPVCADSNSIANNSASDVETSVDLTNTTTKYQTTEPQPPNYLTYTGKPKHSNSQDGPLTVPDQRTPNAYTPLSTSEGALATNHAAIGDTSRRIHRDVTPTGTRYHPSKKSHSTKRDKEYARVHLQDIPITDADDDSIATRIYS